MPRKKTLTYAKPQEYDIGNGVTVTITYPVGHRPKMQHLDTVVIVGEHACGFVARLNTSADTASAEPDRGPSLDEIRAFQERREGKVKKPFTSEDAAREAGFPAAALTFERLSGVAAAMPPVAAEDLVE